MQPVKWFLTCMVAVTAVASAAAVEIPPLGQRAEWFRHDRFGSIVHWGLYSLIGRGEWVRDTGRIPLDEYNKLVGQFNPSQFDARRWVALAKQAGQKYLVITTKHHDGFCLFHSKLTDYGIQSTPFRRDAIQEIAGECHRQGLRLGLYYSIMDWHHPDYLPRRPWEKNRSTAGANFDRYVEYMRGQIHEILSNYGRVDELWLDGGWERKSPEDQRKFRAILAEARQLQPRILINDRAFIDGDYETPEQFVPATGLTDKAGRPTLWEATMTMSTGHGAFAPTAWWGYDRSETVFKPADELVQKLVDITSKGGNLLLNIGPLPDGTIRAEEAERLAAIGHWVDRYGDAIFGSTASPFHLLPFFGRVTVRGNKLYVCVFDWPEDRQLVLPRLKTTVRSARLLGQPATLAAERRGGDVVIALPPQAPDAMASVVVVELAGPPQVEPLRIAAAADGSIGLPALYAEIEAQHGQRAKPMSKGGRAYIGNWSNPADVVVWHFDLPRDGSYRVQIDALPAAKQALGQAVQVAAGGATVQGKIDGRGVELSSPLKLAAGKITLAVRLPGANRKGPPILDLYGVKLSPVK
jgi:alpha-L-fucosidase